MDNRPQLVSRDTCYCNVSAGKYVPAGTYLILINLKHTHVHTHRREHIFRSVPALALWRCSRCIIRRRVRRSASMVTRHSDFDLFLLSGSPSGRTEIFSPRCPTRLFVSVENARDSLPQKRHGIYFGEIRKNISTSRRSPSLVRARERDATEIYI